MDDIALKNAILHKRARNIFQELNSVPMLGKKDIKSREIPLIEENKNDEWKLFFDESPFFNKVFLYPPVVGPHYRTILTRVQ